MLNNKFLVLAATLLVASNCNAGGIFYPHAKTTGKSIAKSALLATAAGYVTHLITPALVADANASDAAYRAGTDQTVNGFYKSLAILAAWIAAAEVTAFATIDTVAQTAEYLCTEDEVNPTVNNYNNYSYPSYNYKYNIVAKIN